MSRTSLKNKNKTKTTKATASVSRVSKRPVVVFDSGVSKSAKDTVFLYRVVFKSRQATLLALFFCVCFLSQPFQNVYASPELETALDSTPEPIVIIEEVEPIVVESSAIPATVDSSEEVSAYEEVSEEQSVIQEIEAEAAEALDGPQEETEEVAPNSTEVTVSDSVINQEETSQVSEMDEEFDLAAEYEQYEEVAADYGEVIDDASDGQFVENIHVVSTHESDGAYSFSKDECTRIEDGSFYCQEREQRELVDDTLLSAPDADGDLEIYLIRDGEQIQITNNRYDDASPYYDEKSNTIVWHRLLDDRYQIISYDPETGEELQLTSGYTNNMEPARQGDMIVWQRWVNDNWEIILYDGKQELQITDSKAHDTAPHIRGPLIIWNSRAQSGEQTLKTYDIENKSFTTITDGDGVSVGNPRMVVMYEAMYENGDVIMKGFDLVTGEIIPLNAIPREMPEDIPSTDTTGETRALIQSKPSVRDTVVESTASSGTPSLTPPLPEPDNDSETLDLRTDIMSSDIQVDENPTDTIPVLVIPPLEAEG